MVLTQPCLPCALLDISVLKAHQPTIALSSCKYFMCLVEPALRFFFLSPEIRTFSENFLLSSCLVLLSRCVFPYYCPPGSAHPLPCEGGFMALSLPGPRDSFEKFCRICDAGSYRNVSASADPCQPCPAGFICPQGKWGC